MCVRAAARPARTHTGCVWLRPGPVLADRVEGPPAQRPPVPTGRPPPSAVKPSNPVRCHAAMHGSKNLPDRPVRSHPSRTVQTATLTGREANHKSAPPPPGADRPLPPPLTRVPGGAAPGSCPVRRADRPDALTPFTARSAGIRPACQSPRRRRAAEPPPPACRTQTGSGAR